MTSTFMTVLMEHSLIECAVADTIFSKNTDTASMYVLSYYMSSAIRYNFISAIPVRSLLQEGKMAVPVSCTT